MSTPMEHTRDTYAQVIDQEPHRSLAMSVGILMSYLLLGLVIAVVTQGWWVPWLGR